MNSSTPSPARIFLSWHEPILPQAARRLIDHYAAEGVADLRGVIAVLPGGRARRRLVELLLEECEARELTLVPPESVTVGGLADRLLSVPRRLADGAASRRAWSRALRAVDADTLATVFPTLPESAEPAAWDPLAEIVAGLHESVAREGHRFSDVLRVCGTSTFDDTARWRVLAEVREIYLEELGRAGLLDPHEIRIAALSRGVPPHSGDVWLISVVDLPSVARGLLEKSGAPVHVVVHAPETLAAPSTEGTSEAFDRFGLPDTDYWESAEVPITDRVLRVVDRPADQADAVVEALEALGGRHAPEEVVISVHPDSEVVPFLEQRLEARGAQPRYAAGTPLPRTAPVRLLQSVADLLDERTYEALAALLRHPHAGPLVGDDDRARLDAIEAADRFHVDHLPYRIGDSLPRARGRAAGLAPAVAALTDSPAVARLEGRRRLSRWMPDVLALLQVVYGARPLDRSRVADRQVIDVLLRIRSAALALASLPESLDETTSAPAAIRALLLELKSDTLPPEARREALDLLDWLEIPLDDAPVALITGFNEGFLPESVVGHPFLPDSLRSQLGMTDNRRRIARDAYRLTTVLRSRPAVFLVAGRRSSTGDPVRPSRLMFRTSDTGVVDRVLTFFRDPDGAPRRPSLASLGLRPGTQSRFSVPPEPVLTLSADEIPDSLSVTAFRAFIADPYRFVLERIFRLGSTDDEAREMDPMVFGTVAHDVLQRFGAALIDQPAAIDGTDADQLRSILFDLLDRTMAERFGDAALPAVTLQARQLRARLASFADAQAEWALRGWRIAAVERGPDGDGVPFDVDGRPLHLRGRIDRIDHNPETGHWAVLDYKTGNALQSPDKTHRKGSKANRRWVDLQLPLYRRLVAGISGADGHPLLDAGAAAEGRITLGYVGLPRDPSPSPFLIAEWTDEEIAEAEEVAREVVRRLREGIVHFDASITKPARFGSDPLEPFITRGWQAPDSDDTNSTDDTGEWS